MLFPFLRGPAGRHIVVDASGRLIASGDTAASGYIFGYGDTGRPLVVDASGRLLLSALSAGLGGGGLGTTIKSLAASSGNITFNLNQNAAFHLPLTGNANFTLSGPIGGAKYIFVFKNNNGGGKGLSWPASVKWRDGLAPTLTTTSGAYDVITMFYDNIVTLFFADFGLSFS